MASDVLTRVDAFNKKADELADKGHLLRAAENFGRAAEAARPLGEDNLVAVDMQVARGNALCAHAGMAAPESAADRRILAGCRAESISLFSGAVAVLERRRVAGTLLEGKCTAVEEACRARAIQRANVDVSDAEAASWATLVGYETFLSAAGSVLSVLSQAQACATACSAAQFQSFAQHVAHAAELMQQPRSPGEMSLNSEATFTEGFRIAVAVAGANGLDARLVKLLADALQRLERSGVLQARRTDEHIGLNVHKERAMQAAVQSSLTAPGLRRCALPGCGAREAHPAHFKSCAACRTVVYCCREHQVAGWPAHKKACKAARKAAAAASEDGGAGPSGA